MKASFARSVKVNIIIGLKIRSNGNVKAVNLDLHFKTKKGISCNELKRQLDLPGKESVLRMLHVSQTAMGKHDDMYSLKKMSELDEEPHHF